MDLKLSGIKMDIPGLVDHCKVELAGTIIDSSGATSPHYANITISMPRSQISSLTFAEIEIEAIRQAKQIQI